MKIQDSCVNSQLSKRVTDWGEDGHGIVWGAVARAIAVLYHVYFTRDIN